MNDDEDFSGLPTFAYFVDKRSIELQQLIRTIPEFGELRVVRQSWGNNWKLDPYIIQDEDKKNLIILEPEIIEVLSDVELLAFIDVEMQQIEHYESTFWLLIATMFLTPVTITNSVMLALAFPRLNSIIPMEISLALVLLTLIIGFIYYRKRKYSISVKHHIDLVAAQENLAFLSALQKLASLPDLVENPDSGKRLRYIERTLSGSDT